MTIKDRSYQLARAYFDAVSQGDLPDDLLTPDMTGWITTGGAMDKARYQDLVRLLAAMCAGPLTFTIHSLTADEDRVVAEADSEGLLINGETYRNTYVFVFRIRDDRIASVAEHYNPLVAQEKLVPLMKDAAARIAG
ncbi:nuclear transport factor 2 family protein [Phenylobacterium sp. LjRoot225]|uniref:nuclear transport factor 2 family protein n=1 Tax=Phenylobacterium sp. LjRoot225 TaxID=3342285 RepID=UPI003ECCD164